MILCAIRSGKQSDPRLAFYCTVSTSSKTVYTGQSKRSLTAHTAALTPPRAYGRGPSACRRRAPAPRRSVAPRRHSGHAVPTTLTTLVKRRGVLGAAIPGPAPPLRAHARRPESVFLPAAAVLHSRTSHPLRCCPVSLLVRTSCPSHLPCPLCHPEPHPAETPPRVSLRCLQSAKRSKAAAEAAEAAEAA